MEPTNKQDQDVKNANTAVQKAYEAIIKEVKQMLVLFPTEELRTYVERVGTVNDSHSFYSPMIYIGVGEYFGKRMLSFAKNFKVKPHIGNTLDTAIVRCIYKHTGVSVSKINIEDRLEEYTYYGEKYKDAVTYSETIDNYKKETANPTRQEA
jgi:hypothetical protein